MSRESQIVEMFTRAVGPLTVAQIAAREGVSRLTIYLILHRHDVVLRPRGPRLGGTDKPPRVYKRRELRASGGRHSRFVAAHPDPETAADLPAHHAAVVEGRTLFPGRVTATLDSPRFLVGGENDPKTGKRVLKGEWAGMPIYTLTLQERDTCPRSCPVWRGCMGNGMPWPRRNDARDPAFMGALEAEVVTKAREHPTGFVVRLHVLGDFFSVPYVLLWGELLARLPMLRVYGYTARRVDRDDLESRSIARAIDLLRGHFWERFAIRTSHTEAGPARSVMVDADPRDDSGLVCPAQTDKTACCGTCGLCWSPAFKERTVYFLRHGNPRLARG